MIAGTMEQQFDSLNKIKSLPANCKVFCAHEYTLKNLEFMEKNFSSFPSDIQKKLNFSGSSFANLRKKILEKIEKTGASVPLELNFEKSINAFLVADTLQNFIKIRQMRNNY